MKHSTTTTPDVEYYVTDHLGSVCLVTDGSGVETQRYIYGPYGNIEYAKGTSDNRYLFQGKEFDVESGTYYFGARYYDVKNGRWLARDPKEQAFSSYVFCANNPLNYVDPTGQVWKDYLGNELSSEQLKNIKSYIIYDPKEKGIPLYSKDNGFVQQAHMMFNRQAMKYGGQVAWSHPQTTEEFAEDWGSMDGNIKEVNLLYHGTNQALHVSSDNKEYITATNNGETNISGTPAKNISDLPTPKGNISGATLNIYSCRSLNKTASELKGSKLTLGEAFRKSFNFEAVKGTKSKVNFYMRHKPGQPLLAPYPKSGEWELLKR